MEGGNAASKALKYNSGQVKCPFLAHRRQLAGRTSILQPISDEQALNAILDYIFDSSTAAEFHEKAQAPGNKEQETGSKRFCSLFYRFQ